MLAEGTEVISPLEGSKKGRRENRRRRRYLLPGHLGRAASSSWLTLSHLTS